MTVIDRDHIEHGVNHEKPFSDVLLISQIKEGNKSAVTYFVNSYRQRIFSVVYNITYNAEDATEITQDVLIKALDSICSFKQNSSIFTWLYRIAVNMAISAVRKKKRKSTLSLNELEEAGFSPKDEQEISIPSGGDRKVFLSELQKNLNDSLQKLSNEHRVVFVLFEIEGLSHDEISQIVGVSVGTVRSRLHYAKQELRKYLHEYL